MSIAGSRAMGTPFFHELKKQASFFFKEKMKTARLALTDVTPAQLLTEEATCGNPWAPDSRTMAIISRAAFEIDDYGRITEILHMRLSKFDRKNWKGSYHALILLEHLITHGPESTAQEFQSDQGVIEEMGTFQHIDELGFNWGLHLRKKSGRVLKLLEKGPVLREERDRARKVTRGIKGFGSFDHRWSSDQSEDDGKARDLFRKCNSRYEGDIEQRYDAVEDVNESPTSESKPLLVHSKEEQKVGFQTEEHAFGKAEHQNMEYVLLFRPELAMTEECHDMNKLVKNLM